MRILVISDSHGMNENVKGVLKQVGHIDMLIHCGDVTSGDLYIESLVSCPVHMVAGNLDQGLHLPKEKLIELEGHRIWIVHGHTYRVNQGLKILRGLARRKGADIVMFGHTHKPYIELGEDMTILNPGSLTYPRQRDGNPTFLIMEIDEFGDTHFGHGYYHKDLNREDQEKGER
ncbi:MAG: metallophosphoesterase [Eubacterium sp.]|nr:metallophosphoesterase [Eubacterium sp.]